MSLEAHGQAVKSPNTHSDLILISTQTLGQEYLVALFDKIPDEKIRWETY